MLNIYELTQAERYELWMAFCAYAATQLPPPYNESFINGWFSCRAFGDVERLCSNVEVTLSGEPILIKRVGTLNLCSKNMISIYAAHKTITNRIDFEMGRLGFPEEVCKARAVGCEHDYIDYQCRKCFSPSPKTPFWQRLRGSV